MSKEMNKILEIVKNYQINSEIEARKINKDRIDLEKKEKTESEEKSRKNKEIVENLGIVELFNEIIDSGLLKYKDSPVVEEVPVYKNKIFGGQVIDHWENKKKSEYTPAYISYGHENQSVSLCFGYWTRGGGDNEEHGYEEIKAVVTPLKTISLETQVYVEDGDRWNWITKQIPLNKEKIGEVIGTEVLKHI